ncbi:hypothetical protein TcasGA2_TC034191 [Tribolium castaneum]|uniref:Uncharacterized protein n=1 Tax=Tribolium castaneum TaxID=7070 RepID=A0A139WCQ4_TRICA|nr:hypothetical protein TcasGA2_TC034191 [Tribolium castaneum]
MTKHHLESSHSSPTSQKDVAAKRGHQSSMNSIYYIFYILSINTN